MTITDAEQIEIDLEASGVESAALFVKCDKVFEHIVVEVHRTVQVAHSRQFPHPFAPPTVHPGPLPRRSAKVIVTQAA